MKTLQARTLEMLRTELHIQKFNAVFAGAVANDNMIEEAMRGPECIDADEVVKMHDDGKLINDTLNRLAEEIQKMLSDAGIRVESEWGMRGDWAIFLSPHRTYSRTREFLITSDLTINR